VHQEVSDLLKLGAEVDVAREGDEHGQDTEVYVWNKVRDVPRERMRRRCELVATRLKIVQELKQTYAFGLPR